MFNTGVGVSAGECDNILDKGPTELVTIVNMLHMFSYGQQGGLRGITFLTTMKGRWNLMPLLTCCCSLMVNKAGVGCCGGDNVLDDYDAVTTELVAVVNMLHILSYGQQGEGGG